jgi:hypothetical protein
MLLPLVVVTQDLSENITGRRGATATDLSRFAGRFGHVPPLCCNCERLREFGGDGKRPDNKRTSGSITMTRLVPDVTP